MGRGLFSDGGGWRLHVQTFPEELNFWLEQLYDAGDEGLPEKTRVDLRAGLEAGSGINWNESALGPDEAIRAKFGVQYDNTHVVTGQVQRGAQAVRAELDTGEVVEGALLRAPDFPVDFFVVDAAYPKWVVAVEAVDETGARLGVTPRSEPSEWRRQRRTERAERRDH